MSTRIALFAADFVGNEITRLLCDSPQAEVVLLCLSASNRGSVNQSIHDCVAARFPHAVVTHDTEPFVVEEALRKAQPDLGILAWWPHILKSPLLDLPTRGWVNTHPSFLPHHRGKDPNFWCLVEGGPAGATLHEVTSKVDEGPIIAQSRLEIGWTDTGESVYLRTRALMVELFRTHLSAILTGSYQPIAQPDIAPATHTRKQLDGASQIFLDKQYTGRELLNILRARTFPPHPGAFFVEDENKFSLELRITQNPVKPSV